MTTLIERLERGDRWDGDNLEVLRALGWRISKLTGHGKPPDKDCKVIASNLLPRPLDSVDAALRLVPEGWLVLLDQGDEGWDATVHQASEGIHPCYEGSGATAAVALTCALLRAHGAP